MNVKPFKLLLLPLVFIMAMSIPDNDVAAVLRTKSYLHAVKSVSQKELDCLAKNIYFEARGEPKRGQVAVARVVANRVEHGFAETFCDVVYQKSRDARGVLCQFSWVCQGKRHVNEKDPAFQNAREIAFRVLAFDDYKHEIPKQTLFFHSTSVKPKWRYKKVEQIGNHIFYEKI